MEALLCGMRRVAATVGLQQRRSLEAMQLRLDVALLAACERLEPLYIHRMFGDVVLLRAHRVADAVENPPRHVLWDSIVDDARLTESAPPRNPGAPTALINFKVEQPVDGSKRLSL